MKHAVNASIITIGDELLIGQTIDTNSAWMAGELNKIGVWVHRRIAVGDDRQHIRDTLDQESAVSDIILITGGLGPTADDITKPLLCEYFGSKLVRHDQTEKWLHHLFTKVLKRPMIERNLQQADLPDNCTVLANPRGTAPGMMFEKNQKIYISMPGVPHEMKGIMTDHGIPFLKKRFKLPVIHHRTLLTAGQGESFIAEMLVDFEKKLPEGMSLAYLPAFGMVRLRLSAEGSNSIEKKVDEKFEELKSIVKPHMVTDVDESLEESIGKMLKEQNAFVGSAESCTGGYIAHLLTRHSGSSSTYKGGIVSYANTVKENVLGVAHSTIAEKGAVSEETVKQMVAGALEELDVDYAVATSGIMGPDGGTKYKPVGTVWIGVGNEEKIIAKQYHFRYDRDRNIEVTALTALNLLRQFIKKEVE